MYRVAAQFEILVIMGTILVSGCASLGPQTVKATVDMPGTTAQQINADVAREMAREVFCADGDIREVTTVSTEGRARILVTSENLVWGPAFLRKVRQAIADADSELPRGAVVQEVDLLPPGTTVPVETAGPRVERLRIDLDQGKLIAAGVTSADVYDAVAKARKMAALPNGTAQTLSPATQASPQMIDTLAATPVRSRSGYVKLGDVARIRIVELPCVVVRHWP